MKKKISQICIYTKTWSGGNLWIGALEWSGFWSGDLADSDQENIWKSINHDSPFKEMTSCKGTGSN